MEGKKVVLHYFPMNGRGVFLRAILSYGKVDFENKLVDPAKYKETSPKWGLLPVLEIDGKAYGESKAIAFYLAGKLNLMGKTHEDALEIMQVVSATDNFQSAISPLIFPTEEQVKNAETHRKNLLEKLTLWLGRFEVLYKDLGFGKYFLGETFSFADIFIATNLRILLDAQITRDFVKEELFEKASPNLWKLMNRVKENELKEFFEKYYLKDVYV